MTGAGSPPEVGATTAAPGNAAPGNAAPGNAAPGRVFDDHSIPACSTGPLGRVAWTLRELAEILHHPGRPNRAP